MSDTAPDFMQFTPSGHGWVYPNADGSKAKCGGPAICMACANDQANMRAAKMFAEEILTHQYAEPYNVTAQLLEAMKGQLLIVLVNRLGGKVELPVSEVDATGGWMMHMAVDHDRRVFTFETRRKS